MHKHYIVLIVLFSYSILSEASREYSLIINEKDFEYIYDKESYLNIIPNDNSSYSLSYDTNEPALPLMSYSILVPKNAIIKNVKYKIKKKTLFKDVTMAPCPKLYQSDMSKKDTTPIKPTYKKPVYPENVATMLSMATKNEYKYARFIVSPFIYHPNDRHIEFVHEIVFILDLDEDMDVESDMRWRNNSKPFKNAVINQNETEKLYPLSATGLQATTTSPQIEYLIITADSLKNSFISLSRWKYQKGIPSKIITIEEILQEYDGSTPQLKIKNCLHDYYLNTNLKWVLLGGDNTIIPVQYCYNSYAQSIPIPSDMFYGCFDGSFDWNLDGDDKIGEFQDSVDLIPEIHVSRLPIRTSIDAKSYIDKSLNYEKKPKLNNYIENMLLSGTLLHEYWFYFHDINESDSHLMSEKMYTDTIQPFWSGTKKKFYDTGTDFPGNELYDVSIENYHNQLNNGGYHLVHMTSHGDKNCVNMEKLDDAPQYYTHQSASTLNNENKFIFVTMACETNKFDDPYTDPCFSEAMIRNPNGGCIAYLGGSRYGFFTSSLPVHLTYSIAYDAGFFFDLLSDTITPKHFSEIVSTAKSNRAAFAEINTVERWIQFSLNPLGDPELPIYNTDPKSFQNIFVEKESNTLYVNTGGISGCRITLTSNDSVISYYESVGDVNEHIFENIDSYYTLTVTKQNYIPFEYISDVYIQNETIEEDCNIYGMRVFIGNNVTNEKPNGDVVIKNGTHFNVTFDDKCKISGGTTLEKGAVIKFIPN